MDIKKIKNIAVIALVAVALPTFAKPKDDELIEMPKTYPAKYTSQYIKEITPLYKSTSKY